MLLSCFSSQKGKIVTLAPPLDSPTLIFFASSSVTLPVLCPPPSNSNMRLRDILSMEQNQISIFRNVSNILPSHPTVVTTLKTVFNKGNNGKVSLPVPYFNKDLRTYTYFFLNFPTESLKAPKSPPSPPCNHPPLQTTAGK